MRSRPISRMKKLLLAGLIAAGLGGAVTSARADGFGFNFSIGGHRPFGFLPPPPLVIGPRIIVTRPGCGRDYYPERDAYYRRGDVYDRQEYRHDGYHAREDWRHERLHRDLDHDRWHYDRDGYAYGR